MRSVWRRCAVCLPGMATLLAACPTFETFWQGRLIPGACVDTLPFIRAVRCKRSAAAKDILPDDVFHRVRWAMGCYCIASAGCVLHCMYACAMNLQDGLQAYKCDCST